MQTKVAVGKAPLTNYVEDDYTWSQAKLSHLERGLDDTLVASGDYGQILHHDPRYHDNSYAYEPVNQMTTAYSSGYLPGMAVEHRRMMPGNTYLPVNQHMSEMNTTFVNPRQFECIIRLRMKRMDPKKRKGGQLRTKTRFKQTFKYESRSKHAKKRMRASNGKFLKGKVHDETATKSTGDQQFDETIPQEPCNADERDDRTDKEANLGKREPKYREEEEGMVEAPRLKQIKLEENAIPLPELGEEKTEESDDGLFEADRAAEALQENEDHDEEIGLRRHDSMMDRRRQR